MNLSGKGPLKVRIAAQFDMELADRFLTSWIMALGFSSTVID